MKNFIKQHNVFNFENVVNLLKTITVLSAFLAFALSMRQKEFDRFSQIKPLFEITLSENSRQFGITNHGGLVYFKGCEKIGAWQYLKKTGAIKDQGFAEYLGLCPDGVAVVGLIVRFLERGDLTAGRGIFCGKDLSSRQRRKQQQYEDEVICSVAA